MMRMLVPLCPDSPFQPGSGVGVRPCAPAALGSVPPPVPALALRDLSCPISIGADAVPCNTWGTFQYLFGFSF